MITCSRWFLRLSLAALAYAISTYILHEVAGRLDLARTLTPRQTTHVKEALLKGDITIAHTGYKRKTIIAKPQATKTRKNTPREHQSH